GPNTATGVKVTDVLPVGLTFVSATPSQGTFNNGTGLWDVGALANGAAARRVVSATATTSGPKTNTAAISASDQFDLNLTNNVATAIVTAQLADLGLTKSVDVSNPVSGGTVNFTVTLTNNGPDGATGVKITDLLPLGLAFVSATPSQGTYTNSSGLWDVGAL